MKSARAAARKAGRTGAVRKGARKATERRPRAANFLVVTGMSGAGKSHAIRALEDLGYYCVDNLPTPLIPVMADLSLRDDVDNPKMAVVVDVRERGFIASSRRSGGGCARRKR